MKFKELEIFYKLCDDSNMSRVAKSLNMSQSNISLSIKSLEKRLGEELFDRVGKKLILNESGKEFKRATQNHFNALKEAQDLFRKEKISGFLKVAGSRTIGDYILPQVVFDFLKEQKDATVSSLTDNSENIANKVLSGEINIGFIESNIKKRDIVKQVLCQDELIVVCKDAKFTNRAYYIDELFDKTWLLREEGSGTRDIFLQNIAELSQDIRKYLELSSFESIKNILLNNDNAITCISKVCVKNELENGELFEVKLKNITFKRDFCLIYHKNKYKSRLFSSFVKYAKRYFIDN